MFLSSIFSLTRSELASTISSKFISLFAHNFKNSDSTHEKSCNFHVSTMKKRGNLVHTRSTKTGISCDKTPTIYTQNLWVPKIISCLFFFLFFPFLLFAIFQISIFFFPSPLFLWFCLLLSFSTNHHLLFQWNTEWCFDFVIHFILILFLFLFKFLWLNA